MIELIESKKLGVVMWKCLDHMNNIEYVVSYGFESEPTTDFNEAMNFFSKFCKLSNEVN